MLTTLDITTKKLENHLVHVFRVFSKHNWKFDDTFLWANLNWAYNREGYYFTWSNDLPYKSLYRYVHSGGYNGRFVIVLYLNKGCSKFFIRYAKPRKTHQFFQIQRNQFFRELFYVISHEHIHEFQMQKTCYNVEADAVGVEYYGDPLEQSAFAQQAAVELIHTGRSATINSYIETFGSDSKTFKKWYTRVVRNLSSFKKGEVEFLRPIDK